MAYHRTRPMQMLSLLALIVGCASLQPPKHESQSDPNTNIAAYRTFGWRSAAGDTAEAPLRLLDTHIRNSIRNELTRRGYVEVAEKPDFTVSFESVAYEKVKSNPFRIGLGVGSWGGNVGGSVGVGTSAVESYEEGRLVIHAYDATSHKEVWLGTVSGRLPKQTLDADAVARAVALTIQDFPTRVATP